MIISQEQRRYKEHQIVGAELHTLSSIRIPEYVVLQSGSASGTQHYIRRQVG